MSPGASDSDFDEDDDPDKIEVPGMYQLSFNLALSVIIVKAYQFSQCW